MRRLTLHASALSDAEYELYTASLRDITDDSQPSSTGAGKGAGAEAEDDAYFENMQVGVREARAWLRGRYSSVPAPLIDDILKLLSPMLEHGDTLSGSEFFATLRLVVHAENGGLKEVDRSLAFVQGASTSIISWDEQESLTDNRVLISAVTSSSGHKTLTQKSGVLPPSVPSRRPGTESSIAMTSSSKSSTTARALDSMSNNPFAIPDPSSPLPYFHPYSHLQPHLSQRSESSRSASGSQHSMYNPFVSRSPRSDNGSSSTLPPRKPSPPIPTQAIPPSPLALHSRDGPAQNTKPPDECPSLPTKFCIVNTTHTSSTNSTFLTSTNTSTTTTTTTNTITNPKPPA